MIIVVVPWRLALNLFTPSTIERPMRKILSQKKGGKTRAAENRKNRVKNKLEFNVEKLSPEIERQSET